jgi:hypothetical protein
MKKKKIKYTKELSAIVNEAFNADVMSKRQFRENIDARRVFSSILKAGHNTITSIGYTLKKDHASVLHYINTANVLLDSDPSFREKHDDCLELYAVATARLKKASRFKEVKFDTQEVTFLKETVKMLKKDIATLNIEKDWLQTEGKRLLKIANGVDNKNSNIHTLINLRTKPGTEELIHKKINTLFNGVYSKVVKAF